MAAKKSMIGASIGLDGEKEFKQAITGINSDMKVLTSEMKKVTSEFKDNANSVSALTAKQKVLNDQIVAQKSKVEELRKALANSSDQYGENDKRTKDWKISLNNAEAQLNDLNSELKKNDRNLDDAKNSTNGLANSIDKMGDDADTAGKKTLKMGDIIKANLISSAIIDGLRAVASYMQDIATQSIDAADEIATLASQTGFTKQEIQQFQYAGKGLDIELETITGSLSKLTKNMTLAKKEGSAQALAFKSLGVSATNTDGTLRDSKKVMFELIDALGKVTNETERDSMAMQIFGKSAMELNPLIKAGSTELNALMQAAIDNGAVMSDATVNGLDGFKDATEMLNQEMTALAGEILVGLMPTFQDMIAWVRENKDEIKKFATETVQKIVDTVNWFVENKDEVIRDVGLIGAAFIIASGPMAAMATAMALLALNWGDMDDGAKIVGALGAVALAAVGAALAVGALQSAWSLGIAAAAIVAGVIAISYAINNATKNATIKAQNPRGAVGGGGGTHWNAEGGIFTEPTIFSTPRGYQGVGEAGAEAIIPLSKLPSMVGQMIDYDLLGDSVASALRRSPAIAVIEKEYFNTSVDNRILKAV